MCALVSSYSLQKPYGIMYLKKRMLRNYLVFITQSNLFQGLVHLQATLVGTSNSHVEATRRRWC